MATTDGRGLKGCCRVAASSFLGYLLEWIPSWFNKDPSLCDASGRLVYGRSTNVLK